MTTYQCEKRSLSHHLPPSQKGISLKESQVSQLTNVFSYELTTMGISSQHQNGDSKTNSETYPPVSPPLAGLPIHPMVLEAPQHYVFEQHKFPPDTARPQPSVSSRTTSALFCLPQLLPSGFRHLAPQHCVFTYMGVVRLASFK